MARTPSILPRFEGHNVDSSSLAITKAGDGLSDALKVEPRAWRHGDEVFVVLRTHVTQVNHVPVAPESATLVRKHTLVTQEATVVERGEVEELLKAAADRVLLAREEAAGVTRLPLEDDEASGT